MDASPARRVCYEQMTVIMDFMGQHVDFAMGVYRTTEARHKSKKLWTELSKLANNVRGGTKKTPDMWSRYWSDFKNKLKNKMKILSRNKRLGIVTNKEVKPLTKLEKRAIVILGPKFSKKCNKEDDSYSKHLFAEVKVEEYGGNGDFSKESSNSYSSDRLSLDEVENASEVSDPEENGTDVEENLSDYPLSNIYPKWLIEVERKRAKAELIRARAEQRRVAVSDKSADAAMIQAEALKKLSEAATTQADALTRIAMHLERNGSMIQNRELSHHLLPI